MAGIEFKGAEVLAGAYEAVVLGADSERAGRSRGCGKPVK